MGDKVLINSTTHDLENRKIPNGSIGIVVEIEPQFKVRWSDETISSFRKAGKTKSKNKTSNDRFTLAFSITVHKCQGMTLKGNVIIDPSRLFALHHLYVALTRATKFENIYLTEPLTFQTLCKTTPIECYAKPVHNLNRLRRMANTYKHEDETLTESYLKEMLNNQQNQCHYCRCPLTMRFGLPNSLTLDRLDDSLSHTRANCVMSCHGCNSSHANNIVKQYLPQPI